MPIQIRIRYVSENQKALNYYACKYQKKKNRVIGERLWIVGNNLNYYMALSAGGIPLTSKRLLLIKLKTKS
jgi:hypothetical protein